MTIKKILLAYFKLEFQNEYSDERLEVDYDTAEDEMTYGVELSGFFDMSKEYRLIADVKTTCKVRRIGDGINTEPFFEFYDHYHNVSCVDTDQEITANEIEKLLNKK